MFNLKSVFAKYDKVFFDFRLMSISGDEINLSDYKGKTILLVNVASRCGFTKQYDDLQKIWDTYKNKDFVVIGVPSNQFGSQEPGTNQEIKEFETSIFTGKYFTPLVENYLEELEISRKDELKMQREKTKAKG